MVKDIRDEFGSKSLAAGWLVNEKYKRAIVDPTPTIKEDVQDEDMISINNSNSYKRLNSDSDKPEDDGLQFDVSIPRDQDGEEEKDFNQPDESKTPLKVKEKHYSLDESPPHSKNHNVEQ